MWIVTTFATALLVIATLFGLQRAQDRALQRTEKLDRSFRQARIDLYSGYLHVTLGQRFGLPQERALGVARLTQAIKDFSHASVRIPEDEAPDFEVLALAVRDFRRLLPRGTAVHAGKDDLRALHRAYRKLDGIAVDMDKDAAADLVAIRESQDRLYDIVLGVATLLLALISVGALRSGRRRAAAEEARALAQHKAEVDHERFEKIFQSTPIPTFITTFADGRFLAVNEAFCQLFGYHHDDIPETDADSWFDPAQRAAILGQLHAEGAVTDMEVRFRQRDGELRDGVLSAECIEFQGEPCVLTILRDVTEQRHYAARIEHVATHHGLTGLPNRHLFEDRITQAMSHAGRTGTQLAVLYLDLDRFKRANNGYGHAFGDKLLRAVGTRLRELVRSGDTAAHLHGDVFAMLLVDLHRLSDIYVVVQKVLDAFRRPLWVDEREVHITTSIGVGVFPGDAKDALSLINHADVAMYRAKDQGGNSYQFFRHGMGEEAHDRVELEAALHLALARQELHLVYQPKVTLETGRVTGCEALLRWTHPTLGEISPARFIPIAEDCGLIVDIGDWVLRAACRQAKSWCERGLPPVTVAVNVSAHQFMHLDVTQWVLQALHETGLAPELLELEMTESLLAQDTERMVDTLDRLKRAGVRISIDDFGTGYSSLSYLKRFRVDTLKVDQSFVRNMLNAQDDATIALAVISLAHSLGMTAIAEGVETAEQCRYLLEHDCDAIQGYYFSKPLPPQEFEALLRRDEQLGCLPARQAVVG